MRRVIPPPLIRTVYDRRPDHVVETVPEYLRELLVLVVVKANPPRDADRRTSQRLVDENLLFLVL